MSAQRFTSWELADQLNSCVFFCCCWSHWNVIKFIAIPISNYSLSQLKRVIMEFC